MKRASHPSQHSSQALGYMLAHAADMFVTEGVGELLRPGLLLLPRAPCVCASCPGR